MQLNPYLIFNGNCAEAFKFYEQTLGGKIEALNKFRGWSTACTNKDRIAGCYRIYRMIVNYPVNLENPVILSKGDM